MTVSLASLAADVMVLTNRPDLVNETTLAVKAAILKAHHSDDYIKDLHEYSIQFSSPEYYQSLDYASVIPLWRKPRYIRKYDTVPGDLLKYIEPEKIKDSYGSDRTDVFYVAGSNIQIRSSTLLQYCLLGVYINPDTTAAGFSSWIAESHPFAIVYEATALVFKMIGFDEQVPIFRGLVAEQMHELKVHAVTGIGM